MFIWDQGITAFSESFQGCQDQLKGIPQRAEVMDDGVPYYFQPNALVIMDDAIAQARALRGENASITVVPNGVSVVVKQV